MAKLTGNAPPAVSRIVERWVEGDLLIRQPGPKGRRAVTVDVIEKGDGLRHLADIYKQVNAVLLRDLSEAEAETLFALLARVETSARDWLADAG